MIYNNLIQNKKTNILLCNKADPGLYNPSMFRLWNSHILGFSNYNNGANTLNID